MRGRVLAIAGSDSGGGAGIQADIKTITTLGGYAATAITAVTAQDTQQVHAVEVLPSHIVVRQIEVVLADIGADAIKIGMLPSQGIVHSVAAALARLAAGVPIVLDPVMQAKSGAVLMDAEAAHALRRDLLGQTAVLTPNVPEAAELLGRRVTGRDIAGLDGMKQAAADLRGLGPKAVLLKGGHLPGATIYDVLASERGVEVFEGPRLDTVHTHGTGCTLSSAIATGLAQGMTLKDSVVRARAYVLEAIRTAPGFGRGSGPLNHAHMVR
ncbi:MAG TPA: bifunctional hydroxymethylpyrimidine kinase/phosphomethylpyrimidine kinase [Candidatus Cybelea sp.]|nr:bifunctional hydroxymethylpyrimidine kinase/phosphomethylpyrimidine kinase [Candidatus Cybelea sp.]